MEPQCPKTKTGVQRQPHNRRSQDRVGCPHKSNNHEIRLHRRVPGPCGRPRRLVGRGGPEPPRQRYHQPLQGTALVFFARVQTSLVYPNPIVPLRLTVSFRLSTTNPRRPVGQCFWHIMETFQEQIKIPARLTYRAVGSGTGQKEFLGKVEEPLVVSFSSFF